MDSTVFTVHIAAGLLVVYVLCSRDSLQSPLFSWLWWLPSAQRYLKFGAGEGSWASQFSPAVDSSMPTEFL